MYLLVVLTDLVQIKPADFVKPTTRCIEDYINAKYADRVLPKVGLCIGFHSLVSASEGSIAQGTGIVNTHVKFRMIVYRPFKGEIINATITRSRPPNAANGNDDLGTGLALSQDFFEEISVPPKLLFETSEWVKEADGNEAWVWNYEKETEEETTQAQYYFDRAEKCLLRVEYETFTDISPGQDNPNPSAEQPEKETHGDLPPYLIKGSMRAAGLGPTYWWTGGDS